MRRRRFLLACMAGILTARAFAAERTLDLRIEKGRVVDQKGPVRVQQGDAVRLRWRADRALVLHLHGYDIETRVDPGAVAETAFVARATGRYPIHVHVPGVASGARPHADAPLLYVEVHPR
jgi:hypothetical protein